MRNNTRPLMNHYLTTIALFVGIVCASSPVLAELDLTGLYAGVQYTSGDFDLDDDVDANDVSESWGFLHGRFGKTINDILSVEGHLGISSNANADHGVYLYGAYLKIGKDLGQYRPYGLLGASGIHVYEDGFDTETYSDLAFGAGIEVFGSKNVAVVIEYISSVDKTVDDADLTFDTLSLGFTYYFTEEESTFNKNRNKIRSIRY